MEFIKWTFCIQGLCSLQLLIVYVWVYVCVCLCAYVSVCLCKCVDVGSVLTLPLHNVKS